MCENRINRKDPDSTRPQEIGREKRDREKKNKKSRRDDGENDAVRKVGEGRRGRSEGRSELDDRCCFRREDVGGSLKLEK